MLGSSVAGLIIAIPVLLFGKDGTAQPWRLVRCFAGFICSMMWIAAIADEVVDVLSVSLFSFFLAFFGSLYVRKLQVADLSCEDVGRDFGIERRNYWPHQ